jgi:hypothetical protein
VRASGRAARAGQVVWLLDADGADDGCHDGGPGGEVEQDPAERTAWREAIAAYDPATFVFLDETSTPLTLTPVRARAPRGERAVGAVPRGAWQAVTLLASASIFWRWSSPWQAEIREPRSGPSGASSTRRVS